jgi:DNA-binding transcriptional MerR regulator
VSSVVAPEALRIGEVARLVGTTPRTIRYYEEIGLLGGAERRSGAHRTYAPADVERLEGILRLKELLGVSLEELKELVEAEEARAELRAEWATEPGDVRRRDILRQSAGHLDRQLELVRARRDELERLETELAAKRRKVRALLRELGG